MKKKTREHMIGKKIKALGWTKNAGWKTDGCEEVSYRGFDTGFQREGFEITDRYSNEAEWYRRRAQGAPNDP